MKKNASITALLLAVSALSFGRDKNAASAVADSGNAQKTAGSVQTYQYEEVLGWNHRQLIEAFGIPDSIYITLSNTKTLNDTETRRSKDTKIAEDIECLGGEPDGIAFYYDGLGLTFYLDTYLSGLDYDYIFSEEIFRWKNRDARYVSSIMFRSRESERHVAMPKELSFSDSLSDIFRKCGNPDKYRKEMVTYIFPASDSIAETAGMPALKSKEVYDVIDIFMNEDSSICTVKFTRKHVFYRSLR